MHQKNGNKKRHFHSLSRQLFLVLDGVLTMELEAEKHQIAARQGIEIPPQAKHHARNESDNAVEFILISHPTTRGDRLDLAASDA